jgi:hypothetical protein
MGKSDDYRRFAQECLEIARTAVDPRARATLLQMAQVWFRLAENHAGDAGGAGDAEKEPRG